jgi:hypothetical protein
MYRSRQLLESIDQKLERLVNLATDRQPPASGAAGRDTKR